MENKKLELAKEAIKCHLENKEIIVDENLKKELSIKKACFVTLTKDNLLRGCIGSLIAYRELWKEIISNAINAAFNDPRFPPLGLKELNKIKIEISILDIPKKVIYHTNEELINKIKNKGVIVSDSFHSATYLPQVWEELSSPEDFLCSLCMKAGLNKDSWKNKKLNFQIYDVEKIS